MEIKFRKVLKEDLQMILGWRSLPEVTSYMYTDFVPSMEKQKQWLKDIRTDDTRLDWVIVVDDEDVGLVSLHHIDQTNKRCEWAYYLGAPNVRGKGVGRSVELNLLRHLFENLGLNKLCCGVFVTNEKVIAIHEKYGSKVEGTCREQIFKNGEFHDIVIMGVLKSDWERDIRDKLEYVRGEFETD